MFCWFYAEDGKISFNIEETALNLPMSLSWVNTFFSTRNKVSRQTIKGPSSYVLAVGFHPYFSDIVNAN